MNHSLVSFCALQLELEDKPVNNIPDIDFNSNRTIEDLFRDLEISNPVARIRHNKQDPVAHRGTRQMSEIIIETYSNFKGGMSEGHKGEKEKSSSNSSKVGKKSLHGSLYICGEYFFKPLCTNSIPLKTVEHIY